jgi:hypothetical protein
MPLNDVKAVIISRQSCFKCTDIVESLKKEEVPSTVILFKEGGAQYLAEREHMPQYLPCTFLYKKDMLVFVADGLADFMEKWEDYLGADQEIQ